MRIIKNPLKNTEFLSRLKSAMLAKPYALSYRFVIDGIRFVIYLQDSDGFGIHSEDLCRISKDTYVFTTDTYFILQYPS